MVTWLSIRFPPWQIKWNWVQKSKSKTKKIIVVFGLVERQGSEDWANWQTMGSWSTSCQLFTPASAIRSLYWSWSWSLFWSWSLQRPWSIDLGVIIGFYLLWQLTNRYLPTSWSDLTVCGGDACSGKLGLPFFFKRIQYKRWVTFIETNHGESFFIC